ncbi:hypothetical protein ACH3VR_01975 [Microbacterium sp. B2969]|uniref:Gram-positive cocci surface proteins LPxTG domain-containing protein n=1 Tax=Microbacterium alkaliflavum TaxID=3248839 RepID=A0ABW7Q318_9MICO
MSEIFRRSAAARYTRPGSPRRIVAALVVVAALFSSMTMATSAAAATPATWTLSQTSEPASGSTVQPGDTISYTMTVSDTGDSGVSGALVQADLSGLLSNATLGTLGAGAVVTGTTLTWTVPTIAPGGTATLSYQVTVNAGAYGVVMTSSVTPESPGGSCTTAAQCTSTLRTPGWVLSKTSDPASGEDVTPGDTITYTLTATNVGPVAVTDAAAQDDLSAVVPYATLDEAGLAAEGLSYSSTTHLLTWTVPTIPLGGAVSVQYTVTVDPDVAGVAITNLATPTVPAGSCANASDCTTTHQVPPLPVPDLRIAATAGVTSVAPGTSFDYELDVENVSTLGAAGTVTLSDAIPSTLKVTSVITADTGSPHWQNCAVAGAAASGFGGVLTCELSGDLGAAASAPAITLAVTVASTATGESIGNTATVCWLNPADPAAAQQCADSTAVVTVVPGPSTPPAVDDGSLPPTGASAAQSAWLVLLALAGGALIATGAVLRRSRRQGSS